MTYNLLFYNKTAMKRCKYILLKIFLHIYSKQKININKNYKIPLKYIIHRVFKAFNIHKNSLKR